MAEEKAPKARPGIEPLELLLDQMREAVEEAKRLKAEGLELKAKGLAMAADDPMRASTLQEAADKIEASWNAEKKARELAKDAAPYRHAKLSNTQAHLTGDVTIHRKTFSAQ